MVGIILHHIHNNLQLNSYVLWQVGYLATALFFFISGYGNHISLNRKEVGIKWIVNKIKKIYIPFLVAYITYYFVLLLGYPNQSPSASRIIFELATVSLPNQVSWFPKIILLCFLIHWGIRMTIVDENRQSYMLSLLLLTIVIILWRMRLPSYWFNSVFCYAVGSEASVLKKKVRLESIRTINFISLLCISLILFLASFCLTTVFWFFSIITALLFCVTCFIISCRFTIETKVISWIGKNSFEFYLFHICCLKLFYWMINYSSLCYTFSVLVGSALLVELYLKLRKIFSRPHLSMTR